MKWVFLIGLLLVACTFTHTFDFNESCVTYQEFEVRGQSMTGIHNQRDTVTVATSFGLVARKNINGVVVE